MDITFHTIPEPKRVVVRRDERYIGMLIRQAGSGTVWADQDLRNAMGRGLTHDGAGAFETAQAEVMQRLKER